MSTDLQLAKLRQVEQYLEACGVHPRFQPITSMDRSEVVELLENLYDSICVLADMHGVQTYASGMRIYYKPGDADIDHQKVVTVLAEQLYDTYIAAYRYGVVSQLDAAFEQVHKANLQQLP